MSRSPMDPSVAAWRANGVYVHRLWCQPNALIILTYHGRKVKLFSGANGGGTHEAPFYTMLGTPT